MEALWDMRTLRVSCAGQPVACNELPALPQLESEAWQHRLLGGALRAAAAGSALAFEVGIGLQD